MICPLRSFHRGEDEECLEGGCGWWVFEIEACGIVVLAKSKLALIEEINEAEDFVID